MPLEILEQTLTASKSSDNNAIIIGATGLVGSLLLNKLATTDNQSPQYSQIIAVVRTLPPYELTNVIYEQLADFNDLAPFLQKLSTKYSFKNADVFSCLGTTQKDAGSKSAFYAVDYGYNLIYAQTCCALGAKRLFLLSSIGAYASSKTSFYLKTKGELEQAVSKLSYAEIYIFRPSLLLGKHEGRMLENIGQSAFQLIKDIYPKYAQSRPIEAERVAQAICITASQTQKVDELLKQKHLSISQKNMLQNGMKIISNTAMLKLTDTAS